MPKTRKIVMTVFCIAEDAKDVRNSLFSEGMASYCWFHESRFPLGFINVDIETPSVEEERLACVELDLD